MSKEESRKNGKYNKHINDYQVGDSVTSLQNI